MAAAVALLPAAAGAVALARGWLTPWLVRPGGAPAHRAVARLARQIGPALTSAFVVGVGSGHGSSALFAFAALSLVAERAVRAPRPLRLMPLARFAFVVAVPLASSAILAVATEVGYIELSRTTLLVQLSWTCASMAFGHLLEDIFDSVRPQRFALVGGSHVDGTLAHELACSCTRGYELVGCVCSRPPADPPSVPYLGSIRELRRFLCRQRVDVLVLAPDADDGAVIQEAAICQQEHDVRVADATEFYEELQGRVPIRLIGARWLGQFGQPRNSTFFSVLKRLIDVTVASLCVVLLAPTIAGIALVLLVVDGRPLLYRQRRVGERGREFELLKFRSMRLDAEADGRAVWAIANDPRVTRTGAFLRRTHLDELPQLWNVLRGEMSLVGPRPERPAFVSELTDSYPFYRPRQIVKPGITGWAQVRCGYAGSREGSGDKLSNDLYYIKHRSLLLDFLIIIETVRTLFCDRQYATAPESAAEVVSVGESPA